MSLGIDDLSALRYMWGHLYTINCIQGWWSATKKTDPMVFLEASAADQLEILIQNEYFGRSAR